MKLTPFCHALAPLLLLAAACGTDEGAAQRGHLVLPEGTRSPVRAGEVAGGGFGANGPRDRYADDDAPRGASLDLDASLLQAQVNSIDAAIRQERDLRRSSGPALPRATASAPQRRHVSTSLR